MSNIIDDPEVNEQSDADETAEAPEVTEGKGGKTASRAEAEDDSEEDEAEERRQRERRDRRRNFNNARELMTDELRQRAEFSSARLKECLAGSIVVRLRERNEKFLFDWTGATPKAEPTDQSSGDCVIDLHENTLLKIASGDLNPQIGMLSEKISVQGKLSLAVYFFNLIAPFPQQ